MSLEERLEKAEKLVAEVKAELATMRATKRNWPERIEAGDFFERNSGAIYMAMIGERLVCIKGVSEIESIGTTWTSGGDYFGTLAGATWTYLGRNILTIRTDTHEPTGEDLVTDEDWAEAAK